MYRALTTSDASTDPFASKTAGPRDASPQRGFAIAEAPGMADQESQSNKYPMWIRIIIISGLALGSWGLVFGLYSLI
jgi:hypothetical protein